MPPIAAALDFLRLERERGITIASAAVAFEWRDAHINLIDTPGHIDFTLEVERAVRALDGGVLLLDAVAGVQAQTVTVWRQTRRLAAPAIAFVNKLDRDGASLGRACDSLRARLGCVFRRCVTLCRRCAILYRRCATLCRLCATLCRLCATPVSVRGSAACAAQHSAAGACGAARRRAGAAR